MIDKGFWLMPSNFDPTTFIFSAHMAAHVEPWIVSDPLHVFAVH
jgi:hypothetical protein